MCPCPMPHAGGRRGAVVYTAPVMRDYLVTRLVWIISAAVAVALAVVAGFAGLQGLWLLPVLFVGALAGSVLGKRLIRRLLPPQQQSAPAPPRGRESGRRAP